MTKCAMASSQCRIDNWGSHEAATSSRAVSVSWAYERGGGPGGPGSTDTWAAADW